MAKNEPSICNLYVSYFTELVKANFYTGYWDQKRNDYRKKIDDGEPVLFKDFVETERQSRKNCEARAHYRNLIEKTVKKIAHG